MDRATRELSDLVAIQSAQSGEQPSDVTEDHQAHQAGIHVEDEPRIDVSAIDTEMNEDAVDDGKERQKRFVLEEDQAPMYDDTIVHLEPPQKGVGHSASAQSGAAAARARDIAEANALAKLRAAPMAAQPLFMTLPDHHAENREQIVDAMLNKHQAQMEQFLAAHMVDDQVTMLITGAGQGEGTDATSVLFRDFAIDHGFHPVVISLCDQPEQHPRISGTSAVLAQPERVARLQEFEDFDEIPFVIGAALEDEEGLTDELLQELASLLVLGKEQYGFVILKTDYGVTEAALEDLIASVDAAMIVLDGSSLALDVMPQWQEWASQNASGLVIDRTQG